MPNPDKKIAGPTEQARPREKPLKSRDDRLNRLAFATLSRHGRPMGLPTEPVTLTVQQIEDLNKKLSALRHNVNNQLALIVAAAELIKANPEVIHRMTTTLAQQPQKITGEITKFSDTLEKALRITRP